MRNAEGNTRPGDPVASPGGRRPGLSLRIPHSAFRISALLLLCGILFFYRLGDRDLWSSHEARAGMDAQSVLDGDGRGLPRLYDGRAELQKPPLYYWLVAAAARLRGGDVDAWAVRLPAALAALGCVLGLAALGAARGRPAAGLLAGVVLATAVHFTWLARIGRIDMPLTLTTGVALGTYYLAGRAATARARGALLLAGYLALAAGVLLKGPVGLVLPAAVVAGHLLAEGEWPALWKVRAWGRLAHRLGLWWGVPLVVGLAVPWFVWADAEAGGGVWQVFLLHHNLDRALGGTELATHPWWLYGPYFALYFLPWTPLVAWGAWWCRRRGYWRADPDARFGAAWLLGVAVALSVPRFKRADYLLPAYPGAAWFLGCVLERRLREAPPRAARRAAAALAGASALAAGCWVVRAGWYLPAHEAFRDYRPLAAAARACAPRPAELIFFRTEAHALAFHVGRPLAVVVEWQDLRDRLGRPGEHYVVMPPAACDECRRALPGVALERVTANTDLAGGAHERPLALVRARPAPGPVP
jgi:4-amino-4-deoxy-L-arabinose transferase-like glycosyltransferase